MSNTKTIDWTAIEHFTPREFACSCCGKVVIESLDYAKLLDTYDCPDNFFYLYPPYTEGESGNLTIQPQLSPTKNGILATLAWLALFVCHVPAGAAPKLTASSSTTRPAGLVGPGKGPLAALLRRQPPGAELYKDYHLLALNPHQGHQPGAWPL